MTRINSVLKNYDNELTKHHTSEQMYNAHEREEK